MCDHPNREAAMPVVAEGVWCDPCLAPLVKALNDGGMPTVASCCGHGKRLGSVTLADGRWLVLAPDSEAVDRLANEPVAIAGAAWLPDADPLFDVDRARAALQAAINQKGAADA